MRCDWGMHNQPIIESLDFDDDIINWMAPLSFRIDNRFINKVIIVNVYIGLLISIANQKRIMTFDC